MTGVFHGLSQRKNSGQEGTGWRGTSSGTVQSVHAYRYSLRLGTLSNAKARRRRSGTVSEGFRRCAPTSLDDREQCITRCDYVALCLPSYPYVSQLTTDTPSNTNAALTCGTWDALHSAEREVGEPFLLYA